MAEIDRRAKMELQYSIDYFEHYHRGRHYSDPNARKPIFREFPIPYWDPPRPDPAFTRPARLRTDKERTPFREYLRTDSEANGAIPEVVLKTLKDFGLTLVRVVGSGSQGIAALFQYHDQKVVLKWGTDVECMVLEMWAMRQLVGARHIIQVSLRKTCSRSGHWPPFNPDACSQILILATTCIPAYASQPKCQSHLAAMGSHIPSVATCSKIYATDFHICKAALHTRVLGSRRGQQSHRTDDRPHSIGTDFLHQRVD